MDNGLKILALIYFFSVGGVFLLRPDLGATILRKLPMRYGLAFNLVPEEKKIARHPFVIVFGAFHILIGLFFVFGVV